jgi:hypothetical protein
MTQAHDTDRLINAFLAEGPVELADRSYEAVRDTIERTHQRQVIGGWSVSDVSSSARLALVAAAVVIAFVAGVGIVSRPEVGGARPPIESPSPSVSPSPIPLPADSEALKAGTYELAPGFPVALTFDVPVGWSECSQHVVEQAVCAAGDNPALSGASVSFLIVENVVADPCVARGLDPPVGPSVDDLAAAIAGLKGFDASTPVAITVDGHDGKELVVVAPDSSSCDLSTWLTANRTNGVGVGEINRLRIVDVDGVRVMIAAAWFPVGQSLDQPPEIKAIFESVRFPRR